MISSDSAVSGPFQTSDDVIRLEAKRRQREEDRAYWRALNQHQQLRQLGKEGRTSYGAALFENYAEVVAVAIDSLLGRLIEEPNIAGKHYAAWPLLLHFCNRGPRSIASVSLGVVIDSITRRMKKKAMALRIGKALNAELKAIRIHQTRGETLLRQLRKKYGKGAVQAKALRQLRVVNERWTADECRELGLLLLELMANSTTLLRFDGDVVVPTDCVQELVDVAPPRSLPARQLPCLVKPKAWEGPTRDGKELVTSRRQMDMSHITTDSLQLALPVVNYLEAQVVTADPWMVGVQRAAWEANLPLFPVRREPEGAFAPRADVAKRVRVEETLRQSEEVQGLPLWLEHDFDLRGRIYVGARFSGHQGPDHQKALLQFKHRKPVDDDARRWMLIAAATHYGINGSWRMRERWAQEHLRMMQAVAANPLDRLDDWKAAKEPWQFLQLADAIASHCADPRSLCGVPIRMDQTCSGLGHIAGLLRDFELCHATNMAGTDRSDIYAIVAEDISMLLQRDLHSLEYQASTSAEFWLKRDVGRSLAKGPVMTSVYGSREFGLVDQLIAWLQEREPDVPISRWDQEYVRPARYMAKKFVGVIRDRLDSTMRLEQWLKEVSKTCMRENKYIEFQSPSGFPLRLGFEVEKRQRVNTDLHGSRRWTFAERPHEKGQLSTRATNRGITANVVHSIDAALCHAVVHRCQSVAAPLLSNHDCFSTVPADAIFLHKTLLHELRELHKPDWLDEIRAQVSRNAGVRLLKPPVRGNISPGVIGENTYVFS